MANGRRTARRLAQFLCVLLTFAHLSAWAQGLSPLLGRCLCDHGPDVPCECPHRHSGDADDPNLPPCHRKMAQQKKRERAEHPSFANRCGSPKLTTVALPTFVTPEPAPEEPLSFVEPRWPTAKRLRTLADNRPTAPPPRA